MKSLNTLAIFIVVIMVFVLSGCGSSRDSDGTVSSDSDALASAAAVGILNCVKCHSSATPETLTWLFSAHGNPNGDPRYGNPHDSSSSCQPCHNQLLDGEYMDQAFTAIELETGIFANVPRDMVSCESCHGGGQLHDGIGPIPYPRPDWEQCVACHDNPPSFISSHDSGGYALATAVGNSAHNNSDDLHAGSPYCQRCHTVEGSLEFAEYTGDRNLMRSMNDDGIEALVEADLHAVTCAACHVPHDDSGRWEEFIVNDNGFASGDWDPNENTVPDQFDFCTSCHTYYNQDGTLIGSGLELTGNSAIFPGTDDTPVAYNTATAPHYHRTSWYRVIPSTHYDNPLTGPQGLDRNGDLNENTLVEGYVIRQPVVDLVNSAIIGNDSPCFDCHGHEFRTNTRNSRDVSEEPDDHPDEYGSTIHTQWASSAHAAHLLEVKYAAYDAAELASLSGQATTDVVMSAYASDDSADGGWTHYNWDRSGRADCQMCHTATGAATFMMDPVNYNSANNDFSHLEGWSDDPAAGSPQNELLYCWGCHENAGTGALREPGAITLAYNSLTGLKPTLPDYDHSNVCINCHSGRGGMAKFLADGGGPLDPADVPAGTEWNGGTDTHYYAAGATINQELTNIGYMYNTATYADSATYNSSGHLNVGCAECHMHSDESHTLMVVEKDALDEIIEIKSTKCVDCHIGPFALTVDILNHESHGYHDAIDALGDVLTDAGTTPQNNYPYFSGNATDQGHGGAMHNWSYLHHEPGGYAHNQIYVRRLLFDSIDWLTDPDTGAVEAVGSRALDGQITLDPLTFGDAIEWFGGDTVTGIIATRPGD